MFLVFQDFVKQLLDKIDKIKYIDKIKSINALRFSLHRMNGSPAPDPSPASPGPQGTPWIPPEPPTRSVPCRTTSTACPALSPSPDDNPLLTTTCTGNFFSLMYGGFQGGPQLFPHDAERRQSLGQQMLERWAKIALNNFFSFD